MPRYAFDLNAYPDCQLPPYMFLRVLDGNGQEVKDCAMVDTDEGIAVIVVKDDDSGFYVFDEDMHIQTAVLVLPPPVTLKPITHDERLHS